MKDLKEGTIIKYISDDIIIEGILKYDNSFLGGKKVISEDRIVSYDLIKKYIIN